MNSSCVSENPDTEPFDISESPQMEASQVEELTLSNGDGPIVSSPFDSGAGSLRKAIADAKDGDVIFFDPKLRGKITLQTPLVIDKSISIEGSGSEVVTVSGNGRVRVFDVKASGRVVLTNLKISDGFSHGVDARGGAVSCGKDTQLFVIGCVFLGNTVDGGAHLEGNEKSYGGAICSDGGRVTIIKCHFQENSAVGRSSSGGSVYAGSILARGSMFGQNSASIGGAICCMADLRMIDCTLTKNVARLIGGGVDCAGPSTFDDCTFDCNATGGCQGGRFTVATASLGAFEGFL